MKVLALLVLSMFTVLAHAAPCSEKAAKDALQFAANNLGETGCVDKQIAVLRSEAFQTTFKVDIVCDSDKNLPGSFKSYKVVEAVKFHERRILCEKISVKPFRAPRNATSY